MEILRSHPRVVAVGEMGLDFSRNNRVPSDAQRKAFQRQLQIAINEELPGVLHLREAEREGLEMMQRMEPRGHPIHWHCVTGQWSLIKMCQEQFNNSYFGFTPLVYNVNASHARMVAKALPLNRILIVRCPLLPVPGTARPDKMVPPWDGRVCNRRSRRST